MHYSRLIIAIAFVLLSLALFFLPAGTRTRITGISRAISRPGQEFTALTARLTREALGGLPPDMSIDERDQLIAEAAAAKLSLATRDEDIAALAAENRFLQRLVRHIRQTHDYSLVVCEVVKRPAWSRYYGHLTLDRGASDGLRAGQAVLTLEGVVGVISSVTLRQSVVLLYDAPEFALAAGVASREVSALIEQQEGDLRLTTPMGREFSEIRRGDLVCTSNLGNDAMQPGLPIGLITGEDVSAEGAPLFTVSPNASLEHLKYLLVAIPAVR